MPRKSNISSKSSIEMVSREKEMMMMISTKIVFRWWRDRLRRDEIVASLLFGTIPFVRHGRNSRRVNRDALSRIRHRPIRRYQSGRTVQCIPTKRTSIQSAFTEVKTDGRSLVQIERIDFLVRVVGFVRSPPWSPNVTRVRWLFVLGRETTSIWSSSGLSIPSSVCASVWTFFISTSHKNAPISSLSSLDWTVRVECRVSLSQWRSLSNLGGMLNFNCALMLILMLRKHITWLRTKGGNVLLPLDHHIDIHKTIGIIIMIETLLHTGAHLAYLGSDILLCPCVSEQFDSL